MKVYLDCIPCFLRQALEASRMATRDEEVQLEVLRKINKELSTMNFEGKKPPHIADRVHYIVRKITKNHDPYKKVKDEYNDRALYMYPTLKGMLDGSDDRLLTAVKLAIAGNIIDFGPNSNFDLDRTVKEVLVQDPSINNYENLKKSLDDAEEIIYLGDNTGEIVFDKVLIEELEGKNIIFVIKDGPILNDATKEDAETVGLDKIAKIEEVSNGAPGVTPHRDSEEFIQRMKKADLIISKGQGNYEALSEVEDLNIFFLLKAKCPVIADDLGVNMGDIVIK